MSRHRLRGHSTSNCEVFPDVYKSQVLQVKSGRLPADNASQGRNFRCKPEAGHGVPQLAPSLLWALTRGWTLNGTQGHTRGPADTAGEHSSLHTVSRARPSALAPPHPPTPGLRPGWQGLSAFLRHTPPAQPFTASLFYLLTRALCFGFPHTNS